MAYDIYPGVDNNYNFPPQVRQAAASSSENRSTIASELAKSVTPVVRDVASNYLASNPAIIDAAKAAIDATPAMTELQNRPKSKVPALAAGTNIDNYFDQQHVGWWAFSKTDVIGEPSDLGTATAMLEVIAPQSWAAVQRVHDRTSRRTYERSIISTADKSWSSWRVFAMVDATLSRQGVLENQDLNTLYQSKDMGIWTLWGPYNTNLPVEVDNRCTLEIIVDSNSSIIQRLTERETGEVWSRTRTGTAPTGWTPWLRLTNSELSSWQRSYAESTAKPSNVVVISDSNGEGQGLSNLNRRWINVLQKLLNANIGNESGAEFPFIPARYVVPTAGGGVSHSGKINVGGIDSGGSTGFGWRGVTMPDPDSKVTFEFTGTSFSLMFTKGYLGAVIQVVVDGGAPVLVNSYSEVYVASGRYDSGPLSRKKHVVEVTRHTSSGVETVVFLQGLLTWDRDENKGVRIIDSSRSGLRMANINRDKMNLVSNAIKSIGDTSLVIINLGTNDERNGVTTETYAANAKAIVDNLYGEWTYRGDILFMIPWLGADNDFVRMTDFAKSLGEISRTNPRVSFYNLGSEMPDVPTPVTALTGLGYFNDTLHLSDVGAKAVGGKIYNRLIR